MRHRTPARSSTLFAAAQALMPGGVSSPVRAFGAVGGAPRFVRKARGAYLYDVDGNKLLDYVQSFGPLILGHAPSPVVRAVREALTRGTTFGAPCPDEVALARLIRSALPSMEKLRFVSSGTEAVMSAVRLARAATGRAGIVKFDGGYHGHSDAMLVSAGSGALTFGLPDSPGVPAEAARHTASLPYNDAAAVQEHFAGRGGEIAAVVVEPVAANMGVVPPAAGFLAALREHTRAAGALLIFDEIVTGFRVSPSGAQGLFGIVPDLTCVGKIVGGGLPVGAYGGRADLMSQVAPEGAVYQAGTLSGNPLAMAAGIATLRALSKPGVYEGLEALSAELEDGLLRAAREAGASVRVNRVGSLLTLFFSGTAVFDYASARAADVGRFARFHAAMLADGIYLPPAQFEAWCLSTAHTRGEIRRTVAAAARALRT